VKGVLFSIEFLIPRRSFVIPVINIFATVNYRNSFSYRANIELLRLVCFSLYSTFLVPLSSISEV